MTPPLAKHPLAAGTTRRRDCLATLATLLGPLPWLGGCANTDPAPPSVPPSATPPAPPTTDPRTPPLVLPEPADATLPSLLLIGDSTVRNGRDDGQGLGPVGQWGWGHVLARLLDSRRINVVNRAIGGLSSRTYRSGGHWARTCGFIRRGDVVLIQFGHNDGSPVNDDQRARGTLRGTGPEQQVIDNRLTGQRETVLSYGAYLRDYIAECRALGATPVLCTPVPRKRRDAQGRTLRGTDSHAGWAASVAREQGVALIDLDALAAERYDALGPTVVDMLFPRTTPEERVHTNWAGAALNARLVLAELQRQQLLPPAAFLPAAPAGPATPGRAVLNPHQPTLFLVGDSTVRTGGVNGQWGWGERLTERLDTQQLQLANHAMAGRSSRSFLREGRWDAVRAQLKPGDVVLIQFGHNDGARVGDPAGKQRGALPGIGPELADEALPDGSRETVRSFGAYLTRYLRDSLDAGAVPVVLSPVPHKDRWAGERDFEHIAAWGRAVAQREGALFIDLTLIVTEAYRALGAAAVEALFADARTHTNDAGARLNAACVARGLRALPQALLAPFVRPEG
ncbi:MAG: rhamnogalacturonan acetylesterase [Burkholderiales bacterium]|nr:rhamnogalacturonan acetylesterase [Burkholderiales bacterium]